MTIFSDIFEHIADACSDAFRSESGTPDSGAAGNDWTDAFGTQCPFSVPASEAETFSQEWDTFSD